jgi:hypothetical protein
MKDGTTVAYVRLCSRGHAIHVELGTDAHGRRTENCSYSADNFRSLSEF